MPQPMMTYQQPPTVADMVSGISIYLLAVALSVESVFPFSRPTASSGHIEIIGKHVFPFVNIQSLLSKPIASNVFFQVNSQGPRF